jgi:hypothetical protein
MTIAALLALILGALLILVSTRTTKRVRRPMGS